MAAGEIWREGDEAGAGSVDKDFVRFRRDADQGFFGLTFAQAKADLSSVARSDFCLDFESVALDVGGANFIVCLPHGDSGGAKQLFLAELLCFFDWGLDQANAVGIRF